MYLKITLKAILEEIMQTVIIVLDSAKMQNPDLDIIYDLPDRIDEFTNHAVYDNGYDYLSETKIGIWLETDNASANLEKIIELLKSEKFSDNDLSASAEIYISEDECAKLENSRKTYPL